MSSTMPVARYFVFVGAALLALIFISDAYLPKLPDAPTTSVTSDLSVIRIRSDRQLPDRVVFDTSVPTIAPPTVVAQAMIATPSADGLPANARTRDAFAQLPPAASNSASIKPSDIKTAELKATDAQKPVQPQPRKRKVAKKRADPPAMLVAQQPQFGFFTTRIW